MKAVKKMKASPEEFYDLMLNSAVYDVEQATGKKVSVEEIKTGYTYRKNLTNKLGKEGSAIGTFTKIEKPYIYEMDFKTARGHNKISYHIAKVDNQSIEVTYEEIYEPVDKRHDMNSKIMMFFYKKSTEKQAKRRLDMMEQHLQQRT